MSEARVYVHTSIGFIEVDGVIRDCKRVGYGEWELIETEREPQPTYYHWLGADGEAI